MPPRYPASQYDLRPACRGRCHRHGSGRAICLQLAEWPPPGSSPQDVHVKRVKVKKQMRTATPFLSAIMFAKAWSHVLMKSVSNRFNGSMQTFFPLCRPRRRHNVLRVFHDRPPHCCLYSLSGTASSAPGRPNRPGRSGDGQFQRDHLIDDLLHVFERGLLLTSRAAQVPVGAEARAGQSREPEPVLSRAILTFFGSMWPGDLDGNFDGVKAPVLEEPETTSHFAW